MKVRAHILSLSVARGIAALCAAVVVASQARAQADIVTFSALAIDPTAPNTLYAGTLGASVSIVGASVLKSLDSGESWEAVNMGLGSSQVFALAIDPGTPSTLYAGTDSGVFKSTDSGGSWEAVNTGLGASDVFALAIDPATLSTLYAGTDSGVFKSTDGGDTWSETLPAQAVTALAIDRSTPRTLYAGTGECSAGPGSCIGSVFKSTDAATNWHAVNTGLPSNTVFTVLAIDPASSSTLYAGTGVGVFKSTDGASSWEVVDTILPIPGRNYVSALAIDPTPPSTLYAGLSAGVFKSTDGASNWLDANSGLTGGPTILAMDPTTPSTLYAVTPFGTGFFKSTDGATTWHAVNTDLPAACRGDCNADGGVAVDELVTLVSIALGTAQPSACLRGFPIAGHVDITLIVQAVRSALGLTECTNPCGGTENGGCR